MDKLIGELLNLLREILASQQRLLQIAMARQEAMRVYDLERLKMLTEQEKTETQRAEGLVVRRRVILHQLQNVLGRQVEMKVSEIAKRCGEPAKTQLLGLAAEIKAVTEELDRRTRMNAKISETVVNGLAKVLKVMTGLAQHAGLYMRNGRKAALRGIHMLEITA
ncbi:MAG TPA: flagellar export chaperone FlgN [Phycisphaerae bacterium]|nr:flagellar export chaperone FlgN [Phycisphaerae bacterium]